MAAIDLKQLVGRLNDMCRRALEAAAGMTLSRTHYNVEIEHWLLTLADRADGDIAAILRHYEIDMGRFVTDLNRALEKLKTGNSRAPSLAPDIVELGKQAWLLASLEQNATRIRSGHLLWALLADETLARRAREASGQLLKINPDLLKRDFAAITANSAEAAEAAPTDASGEAAGEANADGTARNRCARPVHHRSHRAGEGRKDRSDPGARHRDPADHRHPDAAATEQSDPHR